MKHDLLWSIDCFHCFYQAKSCSTMTVFLREGKHILYKVVNFCTRKIKINAPKGLNISQELYDRNKCKKCQLKLTGYSAEHEQCIVQIMLHI